MSFLNTLRKGLRFLLMSMGVSSPSKPGSGSASAPHDAPKRQ